MTGISTNLFEVGNFISCIGLRKGTLISLYVTLFLSVFGALLVLNVPISEDSIFRLPIILGIMLVGILVSCYALKHFPEIDKKYEETSINVKCIQLFSGYNAGMAILGLLVWLFIILLERHDIIAFVSITMNAILWIGVFIHFAAVAHSFWFSILNDFQPDKDYQSGSMRTNSIYDEAQEKNINSEVDEINDTKTETP